MQTAEKKGYKLTIEGTWCEITNLTEKETAENEQ